MIHTLFLWITIIIIALLIEAGGPGLFYFLSLAFGSAAAAVLSYYHYALIAQLLCCLGASCVALFVLRYVVRCNGVKDTPTNMHALIGRKVRAIEPIRQDKPGTIKIYGDVWLAREKHNHDVEHGQEVTIVDVQGCHLIVKN